MVDKEHSKKTKEGMKKYIKRRCKRDIEAWENSDEKMKRCLTPKQRRILEARAIKHKTYREIGEQEGTSRAPVKIMRDLALKKLEKKIENKKSLFY